MSELYDKVVTALAEHAHRLEVARQEERNTADDLNQTVMRAIKVHPSDWEDLRVELGIPGVTPVGMREGHLWTPGAWLLNIPLIQDELVPQGDVILETIIREVMP